MKVCSGGMRRVHLDVVNGDDVGLPDDAGGQGAKGSGTNGERSRSAAECKGSRDRTG